MNPVDVVAAIVVLLGLTLGFRTGGIERLGGLIGSVAGIVAVVVVGPLLSDSMSTWDPLVRVGSIVAALLVGFVVGRIIGASLGSRITGGREQGIMGASDRLTGALVGGAEALLLIWLIGGLITAIPDPRIAKYAQRSTTVQTLTEVAPPPSVVVEGIQEQLAASGLPQLFDGIVPSPATPAKLPSGKRARALAERAAPATVKVISTGCGGQSTGSGVVIDNGYVVTNAHVVAGSDLVQLQSDGRYYEAFPVKVDAKLDIALLRSPQLPAPSLGFVDRAPERGETGVALGFPGGGELTAVRASVNREILANGRDVYDKVPVQRSVLEIHARVNPGNSGGPLVMSDGRIGGIVFAESPTDPKVGYVLAPEAVTAAVFPALGRTDPVSTGRCPAR